MDKRYILKDIRFVDIDERFQMCEGCFEDTINPGTYVYANISNCEVEDFAESEVRVYANWFEELCNAEDYELLKIYEDKTSLEEMKKQLLAWWQDNSNTITIN